ncbi:MAG: glycine--tRNA ligase subunit beta, partial [Cyanobacteriota bacterium]|nr:glycine--tRNA ligase subunit beta [Cyanobacteriota bacterium]
MASFVLEIGTEELPADFARLALPQLERQLRDDLASCQLPCASLSATSTPRRLVVRVEGLPARQEDSVQEHKGPPAQQAFRDGVPTPAAEGFARRCGLTVDQLEIRQTSKGPFVFARTRQAGRATAEVLASCIPGWIWGLQGRRFMRWGSGESRFSRPVRWLVALFDQEIIPVVLADCDPPIQSDRLSRGHRLRPEVVSIPSAESYSGLLEAADVLVDRGVRAATIRAQLQAAAREVGGALDLPEALFEELVDLVEHPRVISGGIDSTYLSLPPEVLSTVMRAHQRYVPLLTTDRPSDPLALQAEGTLLPRFLCVSDGRAEAEETVRRGNERVLRARLADAAFFLKADHAVPSIDRREALGRVTFAEGLGHLLDRTERLEWCTDVLLVSLNLPEEVATVARRAAHLCKHDLVSQIVGEFPELQGIMGAKYLRAEGECDAVAQAVFEHYRPRGAGDDLPSSPAGAVVALAERFELLLSIFSKGERPSGSSDPYGLRRAGNGIIQILWHQDWELDVANLLARGVNHWQSLFPAFKVDPDRLSADLSDFFQQRLTTLLEEEGFDQDIVRAVVHRDHGERSGLQTIRDARDRAQLLQSLRTNGQLAPIQAAVQRASRLAEKGELSEDVLCPDQVVDPNLFERESETRLLKVLQTLRRPAQSIDREKYTHLAQGLAESSATLSAFFDGPDSVLVMSEDPDRQRNRLNLLGVL